MKPNNMLSNLPLDLSEEVFETLVQSESVVIERIVSRGHTSPKTGWYQQDKNEWVLVLQGKGVIEFENGKRLTLCTGDYCNITAGEKHKVRWTDPSCETVWLAIFY